MKDGKILFERCLHMHFIDERQLNHKDLSAPQLGGIEF